jgi:hypothetical protein
MSQVDDGLAADISAKDIGVAVGGAPSDEDDTALCSAGVGGTR